MVACVTPRFVINLPRFVIPAAICNKIDAKCNKKAAALGVPLGGATGGPTWWSHLGVPLGVPPRGPRSRFSGMSLICYQELFFIIFNVNPILPKQKNFYC